MTLKADSPSTATAQTPLMQQYARLKERYAEEILFFRLGDFYEMFYEDAIRAAPMLEVVLTQRQGVPMCGVPHHAMNGYLAKLLKNGVSVAVAEQMEDPKKTKGMVRRDVVRVVTPGTIIEEDLLPSSANNFLVAVAVQPRVKRDDFHWGLAAADISTGQQWSGEMAGDAHWNALKAQLALLNPSEILAVGDAAAVVLEGIGRKTGVRLEVMPQTGADLAARSCAAVRSFLERHHPTAVSSLAAPEPLPLESSGIMFLDETAVRHLELVEASDAGSATLLSVIDHTVTPLGGRLLRWWLMHPSTKKEAIERRYDQVEALVAAGPLRAELRTVLKETADLERISVRAQTGSVGPKELASLRHTLQRLPSLLDTVKRIEIETGRKPFADESSALATPDALLALLAGQLAAEPSGKLEDGGVINDGVSPELDELRGFRRHGKKWIADLESRERERTGIGSLKIGYNDVFGYYLEVSKSNLSKAPAEWIRKQTLSTGERYITPELKEQEEKLLHAEEKITALETRLYGELVHQVASFGPTIAAIAAAIARFDTVAGLAEAAALNGYVRPELNDSTGLALVGARHPVIEKNIGHDRFVPNDIVLDENNRILIITGPNMAGKSTYLRQSALLTILAQMGSFLPVKSARIGIVDKIFTRIGASDRLSQGQSTFMVEMREVATLVANTTPRSLLILDEVGRGTSTYDGVSIAWAVVEYLARSVAGGSPRTLFATHYFELTQLAESIPGVVNAHATAKEWPGANGRKQVVFLYQIRPGAADRSYGIHVAEMAGLPDACIVRAREILHHLESGDHRLAAPARPKQRSQLELFEAHPVVEELRSLDLDTLTPLEALNVLSKLKTQSGGPS